MIPTVTLSLVMLFSAVSPDLPDERLEPALASGAAAVTVTALPLDDEPVDLTLERDRVTTSRTQFVVGRDRTPFPFDHDRVRIYRGQVDGDATSRVWLAAYAGDVTGYIETAGRRHWIGRDTSPRPQAGGPPALCSLGTASPATPPAVVPTGLAVAPPTIRVIDLAIETDYEYFTQFENADDAAAYLVVLYGLVSDIFLRDTDSRLEIVFARLWETPDDLFNEQNPLSPFRQYWNEFMDDVERDVAQLASGRRDYPYGGAAYLSSLCTAFGYSVVGYINGQVPGHLDPSVFQYDLLVTAHELGHNAGALHTHNYGLDNCDDLLNDPQRGTLMSYCSQTVSGGNSNTDMRFHTVVQSAIREVVADAECLISDCNANGLDDLNEIQFGGVPDVNGNDVPDECEDCNDNGILDTVDIDSGRSLDLNNNSRPDECEPDCNGNGIPDAMDILAGTSQDRWGDGVPDECETDCDGDGVSDYNQIQEDLSLDVDRDARLDACADCDGDGTIDVAALQSAHHAWVACLGESSVREFHSVAGVLTQVSAPNGIAGGQDLVISDGGRIFMSTKNGDRVVEYDRHGDYVGDFLAAGAGGLAGPTGLAFGPGGTLVVSSSETDAVLEFDAGDGTFLRTLVASGAGGLVHPFGLAFGPDGDLYVTSDNGAVHQYDGVTGEFVQAFVTPADNGGLVAPRSLLFLPSGNLLVASFGTNKVLEFDGATGDFVGQFNRGGTDEALTLDEPWCLRIGPDGNVYVSRHRVQEDEGGSGGGPPVTGNDHHLHVNATRIYVFDVANGNFLRSYVTGRDTGLLDPTGFDFFPDLDGVDLDVDGHPDACGCSTDLDGSGETDFGDLLLVLSSWGPCEACPADVDSSGAVDFSDLLMVLSNWGPC